MHDVLVPVITGAGVHILAVMSPGPNFLVISRTAMAHSRTAAFFVTAGVASGTVTYVVLGFLGLSAVVAGSLTAFLVLKLMGAAYLVYLGVRTLVSSTHQVRPYPVDGETPLTDDLGRGAAYRLGLFTMATNPKAALYFLAFFTTIVSPDSPVAVKLALVLILPAISLGWYTLVVAAFSRAGMRRLYRRAQRPLNIAFGGLLVVLGLLVAGAER